MSRRQKRKLLVAGLVIAVAIVVVFWGWNSTGNYLAIASLVSESQSAVPAKYLDRTIEIQGIVSDWSGAVTDTAFKLVDREDATKSIDVVMTGTFPSGFDNGKTVVAKGRLSDTLPLKLTATELSVGCTSKY